MGLYIVLQHSHPSIYSTCYFSSKTFNKIIFLPKLSTFSDRELSVFKKKILSGLELLLCLWTLSTVLRTTLCAVCNTCGIKSTTNDVITYTWEVLNTTTTNQHD